jgi:phosphate regulon transcriptional regulator PhoB
MKVLVVDDEMPIAEAVAYNLRKEGHEPLIANDAEQALALFQTKRPDLIILDIMLPSASGFDVCRRIRRISRVPIIMLTARAEETDRVVGLEIGADDYVTKPFSMRELMARVKTVLRRASESGSAVSEGRLEAGPIVVDAGSHEVTVSGRSVSLTPKEFDLLHFFVGHPGRAFARSVLLDRVWGADAYVGERTVDVHVRWLREKIEPEPSHPRYLLTVRGVGYKLVVE